MSINWDTPFTPPEPVDMEYELEKHGDLPDDWDEMSDSEQETYFEKWEEMMDRAYQEAKEEAELEKYGL